MKLKNIISLAFIALGAMVTSCSQDGYWTPYDYENASTRVSFEGGDYSFELDKDNVPEYVTITLHRSSNTGDVSVPVTFSTKKTFLSGDSTVFFADGSYASEYRVKLVNGIPGGNHKFSIALKDSTNLAVTGIAKASGNIYIPYTWEAFGKCDVTDALSKVVNEDVEIMKAKGAPAYRVIRPFFKASIAAWWEVDPSEVTDEDIEGYSCEYLDFEIDDEGELTFSTFLYADYNEAANQYLYGCLPSRYKADYADYDAYTAVVSETKASLYPIFYVPNLGALALKQIIIDIEKTGQTF